MTETFSGTARKAGVPKYLASRVKKYHPANNAEINSIVIPIEIFLPISLRHFWFQLRFVNIVLNNKSSTTKKKIIKDKKVNDSQMNRRLLQFNLRGIHQFVQFIGTPKFQCNRD